MVNRWPRHHGGMPAPGCRPRQVPGERHRPPGRGRHGGRPPPRPDGRRTSPRSPTAGRDSLRCSAAGAHRQRVLGPLGEPVDAAVVPARRRNDRARRDGVGLGPDAGGRGRWQRPGPGRARSAPGQLIAAAVKAGARHVLVGMGGSATTDGGWGALEALEPHSRLAGVDLQVGCDVAHPVRRCGRRLFPAKGSVAGAGHAAHPPPGAAGPGLRGALRRRRPGPDGVGRGGRPGGRAGGPRGRAAQRLRSGRGAHRPGRPHRGRRSGHHGRGPARRRVVPRQGGGRGGGPGAELGVPAVVLAGDAVGDDGRRALGALPDVGGVVRRGTSLVGTLSGRSATWSGRCSAGW